MTVADGKVLRQEIFVLNEGSLPGEFKIRYTGNEPITIMPSGGIVRPGAKQGVKVNKKLHCLMHKAVSFFVNLHVAAPRCNKARQLLSGNC